MELNALGWKNLILNQSEAERRASHPNRAVVLFFGEKHEQKWLGTEIVESQIGSGGGAASLATRRPAPG